MTCDMGHPDCGYTHPVWWTEDLERDARKRSRKSWLKRCRVCGIIMRTEDQICGDVPHPVPGTPQHRQ